MADKKYESLKIENIVASGVIADSLILLMFPVKLKAANSTRNDFPAQSIGLKTRR